jgi:YbbR domain-containing protein
MISRTEMFIDFLKSKDFVPKIVCFVLAVTTWYIIGRQNENETRYKIRVEFENVADNHVITDMEKRYVGVRIRANAQEDLDTVDQKNIRVSVDLSNAVLGSPYRYDLKLDYSEVPESVSINLDEKKLFVTVDKKVSKSLFVKPVYSGKVASGFIRGNIIVEPQTVIVYGSGDSVLKLYEIETERFSINGLTSTMITDVNLNNRKIIGGNLNLNSVTVKVEVFEELDVYRYENDIEIYGLMENLSYDISETKAVVLIKSDDGTDPNIDPNDVKIWADLPPVYASDFINSNGVKMAEIQRKTELKAMVNKTNSNIRILSIVPDNVIVKIQQ